MEYLTNAVPTWVSILFLIAIPLPIIMISLLSKKGALATDAYKDKANNVYRIVLFFYTFFLLYTAYGCISGWYDTPSLPPAILKFTMIPLLIFLLLIVFNLPITKKISSNLLLSDTIRLHIFRLIGSFFIILYLFQALPSTIAAIAGTGDLITAISSIFVARAIDQKKSYARKLAWGWNTFGLVDIIATSVTANLLTIQSMETGAQGVEALAQFPFCFIPAFAPATIIFLHCIVYRKLIKGEG